MTAVSTRERPDITTSDLTVGTGQTWLRPAWIVVVSMIAGALYAAWLGEDANWDWQNYHEYNVWALLHGGYMRAT